MSVTARSAACFVREHLRAPFTLLLLLSIPALFVLVFASVLGQFARALGGTMAGASATAISAGWAAAFLAGALAFFQMSSSRAADRRLALAGMGPGRVAAARLVAALALALTASLVAYVTLWLRSGIVHPVHAGLAIFAFAAIYTGIGAVVGALLVDPLGGSLLVVLVFSLDVFSGPQMTSGGALTAFTPTRAAADLLVAAGAGQVSASGDWLGTAAVAVAGMALALAAFWMAARPRSS